MACDHKWEYVKKYVHRSCENCGLEQIIQWIDIPKGVKVN